MTAYARALKRSSTRATFASRPHARSGPAPLRSAKRYAKKMAVAFEAKFGRKPTRSELERGIERLVKERGFAP